MAKKGAISNLSKLLVNSDDALNTGDSKKKEPSNTEVKEKIPEEIGEEFDNITANKTLNTTEGTAQRQKVKKTVEKQSRIKQGVSIKIYEKPHNIAKKLVNMLDKHKSLEDYISTAVKIYNEKNMHDLAKERRLDLDVLRKIIE